MGDSGTTVPDRGGDGQIEKQTRAGPAFHMHPLSDLFCLYNMAAFFSGRPVLEIRDDDVFYVASEDLSPVSAFLYCSFCLKGVPKGILVVHLLVLRRQV